MSPLQNDDNRSEPTLVIFLVVLLGAALQQDVFMDVIGQAAAMSALFLLLLALLLPAGGLVEMYFKKRRFQSTVKSTGAILAAAGENGSEQLLVPTVQIKTLKSPPFVEQNVCSPGGRVLQYASGGNENLTRVVMKPKAPGFSVPRRSLEI